MATSLPHYSYSVCVCVFLGGLTSPYIQWLDSLDCEAERLSLCRFSLWHFHWDWNLLGPNSGGTLPTFLWTAHDRTEYWVFWGSQAFCLEGSTADSLPLGKFHQSTENDPSKGLRSNSAVLGRSLVWLRYERLGGRDSFDEGVGFLILKETCFLFCWVFHVFYSVWGSGCSDTIL